MTHTAIITVENVTIGYGETTILENISFSVRAGEIFIILGGSGCGKSTLMKHLIGLFPVKEGAIHINNAALACISAHPEQTFFRDIGVMYQSGALFGSMTLRENIRLPLEEYTQFTQEQMDAIVEVKLRLVGLQGFEEHMPSEISGGMQKRAAIARAMALDPQVIFLDEPSAGLDPVTSADLDHLIVQLSRLFGITFVVVTHELESIFTIADRVIFLDKNTKGIIADGPPKELQASTDNIQVRNFFNRIPSHTYKD